MKNCWLLAAGLAALALITTDARLTASRPALGRGASLSWRQSPGQAAPQPPQVPFRAGVDLVSLNVTVSDGGGKYITDLTAADFNIFEDGVKQEVTFFNRTNLPIALALLLDTSASMDTKLPTAQEAAIGFARRLRPQDLAEVIDFDSRVVVLQNFTNSAAELESAIKKTSAGGSTSLYNAVYIALKDLKKVVAKELRGDPPARRSVVLSRTARTPPACYRLKRSDPAKRSENRHLRDRAARPTVPARPPKGSRRRSSCSASSRRKPGRGRSSPTSCRSCPGSTARFPTSSPASTPSATPRATRSATAPGAASSSAWPVRA